MRDQTVYTMILFEGINNSANEPINSHPGDPKNEGSCKASTGNTANHKHIT